jgi:2-keto-4-pentenoate hydratase/2-oxohepta-3-ene-1,7-dioic acid hydratase in catechol pathway
VIPVDQKVFDAVRNFYAAGINYRAHIEWANSRGGNYQVPAQADIGYRSPNALLPTDADIVLPPDAGRVEYEGELSPSTAAGRRTWTKGKRWIAWPATR